MNKEVKDRWVAALRSGTYEQGRGQLKTQSGKFCCLGVLCDLHSIETKNNWSQEHYFGCEGFLPQPVIDWAGLDSGSPVAEGGALSSFNDNGGTFAKIADLIEKHL